jgi:hypothetical protein
MKEEYLEQCPSCTQVGYIQDKYIPATDFVSHWKTYDDINKDMLGKYKFGCTGLTGLNIVFVFGNKSTSTKTQSINATSSTSSNTTSGTVECIGPDGKHFNTSMAECEKLDIAWNKSVDYMINCNIAADCGGGTIRMSYSQCMEPCSGLPNKTNNTQTNNQPPSNNTNNTQDTSPKVAFQATETTITGTYYCYDDKVNLLVSQQAYVKSSRELYETCSASTSKKAQFGTCLNSTCNNLSGQEYSNCTNTCYSQCCSDCNQYDKDWLSRRSDLDNMRYKYCP